MPDEIRRIDYYYVIAPDKPGEGARMLRSLQEAGVNLVGISAFPHGARRTQLDLIPADSVAFAKAAKAGGMKLSVKKSGFLIQGDDRPGAVADVMKQLAQANINVTSVQVFCAGAGRYGGMLWVKAPDRRKATKVLGVVSSRPETSQAASGLGDTAERELASSLAKPPESAGGT
jgi:predicted amino acid-binding ACT domain protein